MNREKRRKIMRIIKEEERKYINDRIMTVLAAGAEYLNIPLEVMKVKYITFGDKGKFIEDIKWIAEMVKIGQYEFDKNHNFVKVDAE